jgi:hypothetical protein
VHSSGAGLAVTEAGTEVEDYRTTSGVLAPVVLILAQNLWGWAEALPTSVEHAPTGSGGGWP